MLNTRLDPQSLGAQWGSFSTWGQNEKNPFSTGEDGHCQAGVGPQQSL